jgi:peptidoglycan hydrolase-like protein with peptidoglycan-binding domain
MRYREFKLNEAEGKPGYYTVGDSHSNGVGNYGRGNTWKAMGKDGSSAFNSMHMDAINRIPTGSVVAISLGANDLGSKTISQIVGRVQTVISAAQSKGLKVVYLLPTTTASNKPNDPKREELRDALRSAVSVPTVDLGQASAADPQGLHLDMGSYAKIGKAIVANNSISSASRTSETPTPAGNPATEGGAADPAADAEMDDAANAAQELTAGPPYPPEQKEAVIALQKRLQELGYSVGSTGEDGKYGPRTARAVAAFKRDNALPADANTMDAEDLTKLAAAKKVEKPSPTGNGRVITADELEDLNVGGEGYAEAKKAAEEYLGQAISDKSFHMLVRATVAEASSNEQEQAAVMAVILNRVKSSKYPSSIEAVLNQRNQFQAVTGTSADGNSASRNFTNPTQRQVAGVIDAVRQNLSSANKSWLNFTANNPRAYGPGTNINFLYTMRNSPGAQVIGGTVFGTVA